MALLLIAIAVLPYVGAVAQLLYHALEVSWAGVPGGTFSVQGQSYVELTGTMHFIEESPGKYRAWLPCLAGDTYDVKVIMTGEASDNSLNIDEAFWVNISDRTNPIRTDARYTHGDIQHPETYWVENSSYLLSCTHTHDLQRTYGYGSLIGGWLRRPYHNTSVRSEFPWTDDTRTLRTYASDVCNIIEHPELCSCGLLRESHLAFGSSSKKSYKSLLWRPHRPVPTKIETPIISAWEDFFNAHTDTRFSLAGTRKSKLWNLAVLRARMI